MRDTQPLEMVLITGMSGSGKSVALHALEDAGYYCVDNLPPQLLDSFVALERQHGASKIGIAMDVRSAASLHTVPAQLRALREQGVAIMPIFLDASTDTLVRRFSETRRKHPLAKDRPIADGIKLEKHMMKKLKSAADYVLDTTNFSQTDLRNWVRGNFGKDAENLNVMLTSFSYKRGVPREADIVFDTRFLRNPFYEEAFKELDGRNAEVCAFVKKDAAYAEFMKNLQALIVPLLPAYKKAGKTYLTIAIGCTGGQHRSVCVVEELAKVLKTQGFELQVRHRDV
jgi:UPF0042 nucleotide-binding protein